MFVRCAAESQKKSGVLQILVDQEEEVCIRLRSALRVGTPVHSSWVDCLLVIRNRHPAIADRLVAELEEPSTPFLSAAAEAARTLTGTMVFDPRAGGMEPDHLYEASRRVEEHHREEGPEQVQPHSSSNGQ